MAGTERLDMNTYHFNGYRNFLEFDFNLVVNTPGDLETEIYELILNHLTPDISSMNVQKEYMTFEALYPTS